MTLSFLYAKILKKLRGSSLSDCRIDKKAVVYSGSDLWQCSVDRYTYIGYDCKMLRTEIGSFCSISDHVHIGEAEHPADWVSTSPVFQSVKNSGSKKRFAAFDVPEAPITRIGHDVWIGHAATIKAGVSVGNGAIIGSNAMVTHDVPPYAIVGGVPARIIRYRFNEEIIGRLQQSKWWLLPDSQLEAVAPYIQQPEEFLARL